jgi:hypothetical protein
MLLLNNGYESQANILKVIKDVSRSESRVNGAVLQYEPRDGSVRSAVVIVGCDVAPGTLLNNISEYAKARMVVNGISQAIVIGINKPYPNAIPQFMYLSDKFVELPSIEEAQRFLGNARSEIHRFEDQ